MLSIIWPYIIGGSLLHALYDFICFYIKGYTNLLLLYGLIFIIFFILDRKIEYLISQSNFLKPGECFKCRELNESTANKCKKCGKELNIVNNFVKTCSKCGSNFKYIAKFCSVCGVKLKKDLNG